MVYFRGFFASLLAVVSLTQIVLADLRITAEHNSWGGVNFPGLQTLDQKERNDIIKDIVRSGARVVRLFIRAYENQPDPEGEIGTFDRSLLDQLDNTIAAIYHISEGKVKVIIVPHDAHALRSTNEVPCDAYCKKLDGAFLDFYSQDEYHELYKTRLQVLFKEYPSLNFGGRSWNTLSEAILGVDLQNQPWSGVWPIVAGERWLCDMATHLKETLELGKNGIAVITGGISGPQSPGGTENFPDSAFECPAVDVIGIHGYYAMDGDVTAGTPWAKMFIPGNTLTARAVGKKLLLVEEMAYQHTRFGLAYKKAAIWDQGNALNYRGIPWMYSYITKSDEGTTAKVSITRADNFAIGALKDVLHRASSSRSNFDWSPYLAATTPVLNLTLIPMNPFVPAQSTCTFGCEGFLCDTADGCAPDLLCKNSICTKPSESQPGTIGSDCNSKTPCLAHLTCEDSLCQQCLPRPSIPPPNPEMRRGPFTPVAVDGDPEEQCALDTDHPFLMRPWCRKPYPATSPNHTGNPCHMASHCDANEFCDWGTCKPCTEGCLGMKCRSNNKCKTGYCNSYGFCDYMNKPNKTAPGPGMGAYANRRRGPGYNARPKRQEGGANRVWDVPMKVNIPKESVKATGAAATGHAAAATM